MVSEANKTIADGWRIFEEACENAGQGDLPQLLRSLKGMSTPTPTSQPPPTLTAMDTLTPNPGTSKAPTPSQSSPSPVKIKQEPLDPEERVVIRIEGKRKWSCPQETHSKKALLCTLCSFSSFHMDSLNRHVKEHN